MSCLIKLDHLFEEKHSEIEGTKNKKDHAHVALVLSHTLPIKLGCHHSTIHILWSWTHKGAKLPLEQNQPFAIFVGDMHLFQSAENEVSEFI